MSVPQTPEHWANILTKILDVMPVQDYQRFPVDVIELAKQYSAQRFPGDQISLVKGAALDDFEGALYKAPAGKEGWGIIYNSDLGSVGRINFTVAHEFGHYLLHREKFPNGFECNEDDMLRWDSEYGRIENEANRFAANLLMPLNDFRQQIDPRIKPTLEMLSDCANRYSVSLIAVTLRWLEYTECRSVLVVSRDGFILWSRSSERALRSGVYFRTSGSAPLPVPNNSFAVSAGSSLASKSSISHEGGVWFKDKCVELALISAQYDLVFSLIHLENQQTDDVGDNEDEEDISQRINRLHGLE
ncbi:ImmA/IrrE family metallo-endopeptidase [Thalassospira lucentensis]|uniref:ImmA/IrrE family metallo-endopeptidase n=1 Tax=Thalassospira lucentensis TaxID=168935 RepID=UPI00399D755C